MRKYFGILIKSAFRQGGYDIKRITPTPKSSLATLLKKYRVDMIFDVGANVGMSGNYFRSVGYDKTIVSFEPVHHLFEVLKQRSNNDPNWLCENVALGDVVGELVLNVTDSHGGASSFLEMTEELKKMASDQSVIHRYATPVKTIDEMASIYYPRQQSVCQA